MLKSGKTRVFVLLATVALLGGTYVAAASATGHEFWHHYNGPPDEITRTILITPSGGSGSSSMDLAFTRLLPGKSQTVTVDYRNTGTSDEDVYVVFPNETALSALNTLGNYGAVHLSSSGNGAIGDVFDSTNLSDIHTACVTFSPSGCWPLLKQYEIARNIGPTVNGSFSFSFMFASAFNKQPPVGATSFWNSYPVAGQSTILGADGSGSGLPYEIVATQPGITPGQMGRITQVDPFGRTLTVANSGVSFSDQLAVTGSSGAVTYVVTSPNNHLKVTPSGTVITVDGPLAVGTYTVSGTDSDTLGDTGTWSYTLTVTTGMITCNGSHGEKVTRSNSGGAFGDQLVASGWSGSINYGVTSPNTHLRISRSGVITTFGGPLAPGTYNFSGTDSDNYGDTGTWSYTLTVSP